MREEGRGQLDPYMICGWLPQFLDERSNVQSCRGRAGLDPLPWRSVLILLKLRHEFHRSGCSVRSMGYLKWIAPCGHPAREKGERTVSRIVDLSPLVPQGFKGPPSTNIGVQFEVRTKPGYWQSAQVIMNFSARHKVLERYEHAYARGQSSNLL